MTIKNIDGKTPLEEHCDTCKDKIIGLISRYDPKRGEVLNNNNITLVLV